MKSILSAQDTVASAASKINFARPSVILHLDCNFINVICLIRWPLQSVGYTG